MKRTSWKFVWHWSWGLAFGLKYGAIGHWHAMKIEVARGSRYVSLHLGPLTLSWLQMWRPWPRIHIYQQDWTPGFGAFHDDGSLRKDGVAHVSLNVGAFAAAIAAGDVDAEELPDAVVDTLIHEIGHVLQAWANKEFSQERAEALVDAYRNGRPGNREAGYIGN